jgi:phosphoglycolate phosphatase
MEHSGEDILLIGDTLHDLEVAEAMGVDCALVPSGHQHIDRLREGGGRVVESLSEVCGWVE